MITLWRSALCFVLGVALILSAVWCSAVILSGERAVFILVVWIIVGAYLIVRAYTCARPNFLLWRDANG
jgi:hypothetical protein